MKELELFQKKLPESVLTFLDKINQNDFKAGLVGGAPRDFLREMSVSKDIDIELRPIVDCKKDELLVQFKNLIKKLSDDYHVFEKGYNVHEVKIEDFSLEIALPRLELFNGDVGHSNFKAEYISDFDYSKGFKRRDFTLNAIMFEYFKGSWKLIDPLNGLQDLKLGLLRACENTAFVKDPVRFLRAVRFATKYELEMELSLVTLLKNMQLSLNSHYLRLEAKKSLRPLTFLTRCSELRPSVFPFDFLQVHQFMIFEYERKFSSSELKKQISQCLFLTSQQRQTLLAFFEIKTKTLIDINLKEINIGKLKELSLSELSNLSWPGQLLQLVSKLREFEEKKLDWILKEEGVEFGFDFLLRYETVKIKIPGEIPNNLKNHYLLQEKTRMLID